MTGLALSIAGGYGVFLVYTAFTLGWRGLGSGVRPSPSSLSGRTRVGLADWMTQAGLRGVRPRELAGVCGGIGLGAALLAYTVFGSIVPAVAVGLFASTFPLASYRNRRRARQAASRDAWPRILEELRLRTGALGRSIPVALFEANAPAEMAAAFTDARREWLVSTDFARALSTLQRELADPTADSVAETLLVAHEVGGQDLDQRLEALIADRRHDLQIRKDAQAEQAGVRFARRFVLIVPIGMTLAGLSIGNGRAAYQSGAGQAAALAGVLTTVGCWLWAGRLLRLPVERRVFHGEATALSRRSAA